LAGLCFCQDFEANVPHLKLGELFEVTADHLYEQFDIVLQEGYEDVKLPLVSVPVFTAGKPYRPREQWQCRNCEYLQDGIDACRNCGTPVQLSPGPKVVDRSVVTEQHEMQQAAVVGMVRELAAEVVRSYTVVAPSYRPVETGDEVSVVTMVRHRWRDSGVQMNTVTDSLSCSLFWQLHNPLHPHGRDLSADNLKSYTCHRLERAWKTLGLDLEEDMGYLITELSPEVAATGTLDSMKQEYAAMCRLNILNVIEMRPKAVLACGAFTRKRWEELFDMTRTDLPAGLTVVKVIREVGSSKKHTIQGTLRWSSGGTASETTVFFVPHPSLSSFKPLRNLVLGMQAAHQIAFDEVLNVSTKEIENMTVTGIVEMNVLHAKGDELYEYVSLKVDGDQRFVLANGILVHNCGQSNNSVGGLVSWAHLTRERR
jgi:hypothetical protein